MKYFIVIGANYGDEGKGLMTDYLCRKHNIKRVVRFNGGAQAGHTVINDGERHIFSNWGSGTLAGATTELASDVILNPFHAIHERREFFNAPPNIAIPENPIITTPIDIRLNQLVEEKRGQSRHGSCGLGINETVTRHKEMVASGVGNDITKPEALKWLTDKWARKRAVMLGLDSNAIQKLMDERNDLATAFKNVWEVALHSVYSQYEDPVAEDIVYEGAQGLALDEHMGEYPYVTRSNTGIGNALKDIHRRIKLVGDKNPIITIYYMTRTYTTRHGAGPLQSESTPLYVTGKKFGEGSFVDPTNVPNPWQGTLRFAPIDVYSISDRILIDKSRNWDLLADINYNINVCITCMDQTDSVKLIPNIYKHPIDAKVSELPKFFKDARLNVSHLSYGPTAKDIVTHD